MRTRQQYPHGESNPGFRTENPTPILEITEGICDYQERGSKIGSSKKPSSRNTSSDADLQSVADAWHRLPDAVRRGIVAIVRNVGQKS